MTVDRPSSGVGSFVNPGDQRPADGPGELSGTGGRDWSTARLAVVIALLSGIVAVLGTVGADSRWLAALGHVIAVRGAIPAGIPFAAAPTGQWANPLVLAEMIFYGLEHTLGDRGLIVAQTVAVAAALTILAVDARADGASSTGTVSALTLAFVGSLASLAVARVQLFSLVLFPLLVLLLRSEMRAPSRRIYLALPLLALWSNLHGAALLGLGTLWAYLVFGRARTNPRSALAVGVLAPVAMCLTPAGIDTVDYYRGLLTNEAAQRGIGLWSPLGTGPLDLLAIACGLMLAVRLRRWRRPPVWEIVVMVAMLILTIKAARDAVWLLFLLVGPAAHSTRAKRQWNGLLPIGAVCAVGLIVIGFAATPTRATVSPVLLHRAIALSHGTPILADAIAAEQLALDGGRIWVGDPIDAFPRAVQSRYLDWLEGDQGGLQPLVDPRIRVVSSGITARLRPSRRMTRAS